MSALFETAEQRVPVALLLLGKGGTGKSSIASCLVQLLAGRGLNAQLIRFDDLRKSLAPAGTDPFSQDTDIKRIIYENAAQEFIRLLNEGFSLVIDSGMSVESLRIMLKEKIPQLRIIHVTCPLFISVWRDTWRSMRGRKHERGSFLYLRSIRDLLNPFKKNKFPQPGITYPFEYPRCADAHVHTFLNSPDSAAHDAVQKLNL